MNSEQTVQLISHLEDKMYVNTAEIVSYISSTYGVSYTEKGIYDWLIAHHFTYKKSTGLPAKADSDQQTAHIETYKRLVTTFPKDEVIVFMDSAHPTQATKLSYGWIRKGRDKTVPTVAGRKRINLTGAINLVDQGLLVHSYDAINGDTMVEFLRTLEEKYPKAKKIHVIADGAGSHCSKAVNLFLQKPKEINRQYLRAHYGLTLPNNAVILTKKLKKQLQTVMDKKSALFNNPGFLKDSKSEITAVSFLNSFVAPPGKDPPRIVLHILPPYSPNLNPIERVWKVMNEYVRNNKVFSSFHLFRDTVMHFFNHTWDEIKHKMYTRINDNFQVFKTASSCR